jgi:hypothetical protein
MGFEFMPAKPKNVSAVPGDLAEALEAIAKLKSELAQARQTVDEHAEFFSELEEAVNNG